MAADKLVRLLLQSVGDAEVRRALDELGTSGRKMGANVEAGARRGSAGLNVLDRAGRTARTRLEGLAGPLGALGAGGVAGLAAVGLAGVGAGLFALTKRAIESADTLQKNSDAIGINVEELQRYRYAAAQVNVSQQQLDKALATSVARVGEAKAETGQLTTFLKKYNEELLAEVKASGTAEEAVERLFRALAAEGDTLKQGALARAAFGRAGQALIPILKDEAGGLEAAKRRADELHLVLERDLVASAAEAADRWTDLELVLHAGAQRIFLELAPTLKDLTVDLIDATVALADFLGLSRGARVEKLENAIAGAREDLAGLLEDLNTPVGGAFVDAGGDVDALKQKIVELKRELRSLEGRSAGTPVPPARPSGTDGATGAGRAAKDREREEKRFLDEIAKLRENTATRELDAIQKIDYARTQSLAHAQDLLDRHVIDEEQHRAAVLAINADAESQLRKLREDAAKKAADQAAKDEQRAADQAERALERQREAQVRIFTAPFVHAFEEIQTVGADAFYQLFSSGEEQAFDFAETLKELAKRTIAEIAQLLVFQAVIRPAAGGLLGLLGGGGGGGATSTGQGGGGILGSIFSVLGLGSQLSSLSGSLGGPTLGGLFGGGGQGGGLLGLLGLGAGAAGAGGGGAGLAVGTTLATSGGIITIGAGGSATFTAIPGGFVGPLLPGGVVSPGVSGAAAGAGAGASIGAAAAAAGIGAAIAGAIINTQRLIDQGENLRPNSNTADAIAFTGAVPLIAAIQAFRQGDTTLGILDLLLPTAGRSIALGLGLVDEPSIRELVLDAITKEINARVRTDVFRDEDAFRGPRAGLRGPGRAQLEELRATPGTDLLLRLLSTRLDALGERGGLRGDFRRILEGGLARLGARGKDVEDVLERLVRDFFSMEGALNAVNRVLIRGKVSAEEFASGAGIVLEAFDLARQGTGPDIVQAVVDRRGFLSPADIQFEAEQAARRRVAETGIVSFDAELDADDRRRLRRTRRREGRADAREAVQSGAFAVLESIRQLKEGLAELADPATVLPDRLADMQVAIDGVTNAAGSVGSLEEFEGLVENAIDSINAWADAIRNQIDAARQAELTVRQTRTAIAVEVAGLREEDTAAIFAEARREAQLDFANARTDAGRAAALEASIAADRNLFNAQVADLNRAFGEAAPLAGLAESLRSQIDAIRIAQAGGGVPEILALERDLADARQEFRSATEPEDRARAAARVQELVGALLGSAEGTLGSGSARLAAFRELGIDALGEILDQAETAEDIQRDIRDEIEGLRLDWATRLEEQGRLLVELQTSESERLKDALRTARKPDGSPLFSTEDELEAALADPFFRQTLVSEEQLAALESLDGTVGEILKELQTGGLGGDGMGGPDHNATTGPDHDATLTHATTAPLQTTATAAPLSTATAPVVQIPLTFNFTFPAGTTDEAASRYGRLAADPVEAKVLEVLRKTGLTRPGHGQALA